MMRFRPCFFLAVSLLVCSSPVFADGEKDAKKELAFGIDVARRGLWQEARFRFERAAVLDPGSASAYNNLGVTQEQQGEFDKARAAYERARELDPKNISIQQNYDLFREADEKRNKKTKKEASPKPGVSQTPEATPEPVAPKIPGEGGR